MRLVVLIFLILLLLLASFLLLGGRQFFQPQAMLQFFDHYRAWAVPLGFALMMVDLLLPIPSSAVMNWFGMNHGVVLGGLLGAAACFLSSITAYWLCRWFGRPVALRISGRRELDQTQRFFARWGSLAVAAVRPVPMLAEATYCLAGLSLMPFGRFAAASAVGAIPFAFAFAWLGQLGRQYEEPVLLMVVSLIVPLVIWLPAAAWLARRERPAQPREIRDTPS